MTNLPALTGVTRRWPVSFEDHPLFHRTILRAAAAGSIAGAASWAASLFGAPVPLFGPVIVGVAIAAVLDSWWPVLLASAVAGAAVGLLPFAIPTHLTFALLAVGGVVGALTRRKSIPGGPKRSTLLSALGCALTTLVGFLAVERFTGHSLLETALPGPLAVLGYGAMLGLFTTLGSAAAHISLGRDPVEEAIARARKVLTNELLSLADRGVEVYVGARDALLARGGERVQVLEVQGRLQAVACRVVELAVQCQKVDRELGPETQVRIAEQLADLTRRAEATSDEVAKRHYLLARKTLETQIEQVDRIGTSRDRVVAALHGQLALLERTRLSLVALRSSDSNLLAGELQTVADVLNDAAREMEAESEAVLELSGHLPSLPG